VFFEDGIRKAAELFPSLSERAFFRTKNKLASERSNRIWFPSLSERAFFRTAGGPVVARQANYVSISFRESLLSDLSVLWVMKVITPESFHLFQREPSFGPLYFEYIISKRVNVSKIPNLVITMLVLI